MPRSFLLPLASSLALLLGAAAPAQEPVTRPGAEPLRGEARAAVQSGKFDVAAASFAKLTELLPDDAEAWHMLGYSLHALGKLDEALKVHEKAFGFPAVAATAAYNAACVHALKGDKDAAFGWLKKAIEAGFDQAGHVAEDPDMDALRDDPRYQKVLAALEQRAKAGGVQVYATMTERKCARLALFDKSGSPAQLAIQFTPVPWLEKYAELIDSEKMLGRQWRFGGDFWTSLDTSVDLAIGDVTVPAGYHYLTLRQPAAGEFELVVHDAAKVRAQHLDAYQAERLQGGLAIALEHDQVEECAGELMIGIKAKKGETGRGLFVVRFGPHVLEAPIALGKIDQGDQGDQGGKQGKQGKDGAKAVIR
jgi:tetratricopeptide (TPR) repeat protein